MKKTMLGIVALAIMVLMATSVLAGSSRGLRGPKIDISEKDSEWNPVSGGASGKISFLYQLDSIIYNRVRYTSPIVNSRARCPNTINETQCQERKDAADTKVRAGARYQRVYATIQAEPNTDYTLIYYGDAENNNVWPHATCIASATTRRNGHTKYLRGRFDFIDMINDGVDQKFWVVLSSDVDCDAGVMTAWNPSEYIFEMDMI